MLAVMSPPIPVRRPKLASALRLGRDPSAITILRWVWRPIRSSAISAG